MTVAYPNWNVHSVTSARWDMDIDNNGTWMDAFQFGEPDDTTWTLLGQGFELDVQLNPFDLVPLLHLDSATGRIVIADAIQRVIHFNVDPDDIQASLKPGTYVYDLIMVETGTGVRVPLMHGKLTVVQGVTYPP